MTDFIEEGSLSDMKITIDMEKDLTRTGVVGLELTREEVIEVVGSLGAIIRKAQCREVNCDVIDALVSVCDKLHDVDCLITEILED